jgi:sulfur-oxidizing protein SoxX
LQRAHPLHRAAAPLHRPGPGQRLHRRVDHAGQHIGGRPTLLLDNSEPELALAGVALLGLVERGKARALQESLDRIVRRIVANRNVGLCLLCHGAPIPEERFQGTLAPSLAGAGSRATPGQLRLRLVDPARLNPDTIMPPYYRVDGLTRVAKTFQGKTILTAEQIEDVVAYLASLKE